MIKLLGGGALLASLNPMRMLVEALADGFVRKVMAEESGTSAAARNFVNIGIFGAPPRWYWDLPLFPYSGASGTVTNNGGVVSRFSGSVAASGSDPGRYTSSSYAVHSFGGLSLPHLWSASIPTSGGSTAAMTNLAQNMAILRGVRQVGDGHDFLHGKFLRPDSSGPSVHGILADQSSAYLPAVQLINSGMDFSNFFSSRIGAALSNGTIAGSPLDTLLQPFMRTTANPFGGSGTSLISRRDAIEGVMNEALDLIAETAKSAAPGSDALFSARSKAETFLNEAIEDFTSEFETLRAKYMNLIRRCADWSTSGSPGIITGLTDQHISTYARDDSAGYMHRYNQFNFNSGTLIEASTPGGADLRKLIKAKTSDYTSSTASAPTDTTYSSGMHEAFAVTEFLLSRGYSSSISVALAGMTNIGLNDAAFTSQLYQSVTSTSESTRTRKSGILSTLTFDEHAASGGGKHVSLLMNSLFFFQLSSCLYELSQSIGTSGYENTVIHVSSEFSRAPHQDGWGSEHGVYAGVSSIFSGAIKNPVVVGNTTMHPSATSSTYAYYGQWGVGGLTEVQSTQTHLSAGHVASTLSHLLRIDSPTPNFSPLLVESGGEVTSAVSTPASEVSE
jgi:hypothetical protein